MNKTTMRALFFEGNARATLKELPIPAVGRNEVRIRICYCGICGTDQDLFSGNCSFAEQGLVSYPLRPGHEWSGIVDQVGADVVGFRVGDRVVGDNAVTCGCCDACLRGDHAHCRHMRNVGTIEPVYPGAFSDFFVLPAHHVHHLPNDVSLREAALLEPLSVAYGGIREMNITQDSTVAVIGTGCIGMAAVLLARALGATEVYLIGRNAQKLDVAAALGAIPVNIHSCDAIELIRSKTNGRGADFVLECSGAAGSFHQAIALAAFRATIGLIGFYAKREDGVDVDAIVSKALRLVGVMGDMENMKGALRLLERHQPDLRPIITDELSLEDCTDGFYRERYPNAIKIMVKIGEETI